MISLGQLGVAPSQFSEDEQVDLIKLNVCFAQHNSKETWRQSEEGVSTAAFDHYETFNFGKTLTEPFEPNITRPQPRFMCGMTHKQRLYDKVQLRDATVDCSKITKYSILLLPLCSYPPWLFHVELKRHFCGEMQELKEFQLFCISCPFCNYWCSHSPLFGSGSLTHLCCFSWSVYVMSVTTLNIFI